MKSRGKEELTLEQLRETEQPRETCLSSDIVAAAHALEMPQDEVPNGEPQTCFTEADSVEESGPTNNRNDDVTIEHVIMTAVDVDSCELRIQECVVGCEKEDLEKVSGETEKHTSSTDVLTNDEGELRHVFAERHNNQQSFENSNLRSEESDLQLQDNSQDFTKGSPNDSALQMANTELQQELENDEEVKAGTNKVVGVSTESQSQATTPSGKKKRKKRKGKKQGKCNEDSEKDNNKDEAAGKYERVNHLQLTEVDDVPATEVLIEPRTNEVDPMNPQQTEPGDPEGGIKSTEPAIQSETAEEPKPDNTTNEHGEEQTSEMAVLVEEEPVKMPESFSHNKMHEEVHTEHQTDGQDEDKGVESEKIDEVEEAETTETFSLSESLKEPTMVHVTEEGDKEVNSETDALAAAAEAMEEPERMAETVSHTVAPQKVVMERRVVLEVQSLGTVAEEKTTETTENQSDDEVSEKSGMGLPDEEQSLEMDSSEPETSTPPDNPNINNIGEVTDDTSSSDNPRDQTDILMTNGSAAASNAQENAAFINNETESGSDEAKLEETLEDKPQAASDEDPPAPETGGDDRSPSESSTDGPSGSGTPLETLSSKQPEANADMAVSVGQDADEFEREAVTGKVGEDDRDESLAGYSTANTELSDRGASPNLVAEADNTMSRTWEVNEDVESAAVFPSDSEETKMADVSGAPEALAEWQSEEAEDEEQGNSQSAESTNGISDPLGPNPLVSEVDDEDDEGQSFDFNALDVETAVAAKCRLEDRLEDNEEGGQAQSDQNDDPDAVMDKSNSESNENAQPEVVGSHAEEAVELISQTVSQQTDATPASNENMSGNPQREAPAADEQPTADEGGPSTGGEPDQNPTKILAVEEGASAAKHHEVQDERAASEKEPQQQARKDPKKNSKKGKSKGKEDCKMS